MNKRLEIIAYVVIGLAIIGLLAMTFFPGAVIAVKDSLGLNQKSDLCTPEQGYTEQEWIEHMSHHPQIYKECLI